jgi:hypothetical protein
VVDDEQARHPGILPRAGSLDLPRDLSYCLTIHCAGSAFGLRLMLKDMRIAVGLAEQGGVPTPLADHHRRPG